MPIDPEVAAEIAAIKDKILKLESNLSGATGKEWAEGKKELAEMRTILNELMGKKKDTPPPDPKEPKSEADPLGAFIEEGRV